MVSFLLLLGCPPKTPPEGSLDISSEVYVAGVGGTAIFLPVPVPLGSGHPWSGEVRTDAQRALLEGEEALGALRALSAGDPTAIEPAMDLSERARESLADAAAEPALKCIADARFGDVLAELTRLFDALEAPALPVSAQEEWAETTAASTEAFRSGSAAAYESAASRCPAGGPWQRHAEEGLYRLLEQPAQGM